MLGDWSLLIPDLVGVGELFVGVMALLHRAWRQRNMEGFWVTSRAMPDGTSGYRLERHEIGRRRKSVTGNSCSL